MKSIRMLGAILIAAAVSLPIAALQTKEAGSVFRIGIFDGSSREFANGSPQQPVVFIVGRSDTARAWYGFQPMESKTKPIETGPRTVEFSLDHAPASTYVLRVSLLIEHASVPALQVDVNGHHGTFYLEPKLDSRMGDGFAVSFPAYSHAEVDFQFPGRYLHRRSANTIAFSAAATSDQSVPDAGFTYDAIELKSNPARKFDERAVSVRVKPTIFYKNGGGLKEVVDALVRYHQRPKNGTVALAVDGKSYMQPLRGDQDFGEQECRFLLPAFGKRAQARVTVHTNGYNRQFHQLIEPQKRWTIYVVPHVHLDIGYTDYQAKVAAIQSRIIDEALDLIAQHPSFRFSMDGMWSFDQFQKTRTAADRQRALNAIQNKRLFVPAQYSNELTGFPTAETLIRSLYPSANFSRIHGTPFNYANITDVPSYSWSYASILASAGIKYLLAGSNNGRAPVLLRGHLDEDSPFWWEGPDGKKVLFWYSRHYHQMWTLFGLPPLVSAGHDTLPLFLQMYEHPGYLADAAIVYGSQVENTDLFPQQAELAQQWNSLYAYPHLQYSGFHGALASIAAQFGNNIPTVRGDGGPYWEDGIASDAVYAAMERETESRGPSAEKLSTIGTLVNTRLAVDKSDLSRMWKNMVLMDEHTWTASGASADPASEEAVQQLAVKDSRAIKAHWISNTILRNSLASLADSIAAGKNSLVVFNTLNWKRSALVTWDLEPNQEVIDRTTGQVVPVELVYAGEHYHRVRFRAEDVPATGYKVYLLRSAKGPSTPFSPSQPTYATTLENSYYKIDLDPSTGSVESIFDKQLGRELVDAGSPYRFGQYLYVTNHGPKFGVHGAGHGHLISVQRTSYGQVANLESTDLNTPQIKSEIRLFDNEKKIEFIEDVDKKEVHNDEAAYFAFPFAMTHPQFQYEIQNGAVDPSKDMYPGAGLDWFSVQHWVSVQQDGLSATVMPLDASLVTLGDITRLQFPKDFGVRKGWIFSYVMNNYWHTNYRPAQGGHFQFRYVITSASSTNTADLSRQGWEEMTPLELDEITPSDKALNRPEPLNGTQGSFLQMDDPDLLLETWKVAEDGDGTILRFLDLGGKERTVAVQIPLLNLAHVWRTDAVERNQAELRLTGTHSFNIQIQPHEILTVRITGAAALLQKE